MPGSRGKGFSLVELLVMMVILLILVLAFTPLLVSSIKHLQYAGDKSEALYLGQAEMEFSIVEKQTVEGYQLEFVYGDTTITVPGGLIEIENEHGSAQTWLSGFVPYVPTINLFLDPLPLVEGYSDIDIIIMGRDTNFIASDSITIKDKNGQIVGTGSFESAPVEERSALPADYNGLDIPTDYDQYGVFTFTSGKINALSSYMVELVWVIDADNSIGGKARARLQIVLPYAVTGGSGQSLWVSPDAGETWNLKQRDFTGVGTINDITWTGFEYVAVTSNGSLITWTNNNPAIRSDWFSGLDLQAVTSGSGLLVAVGSNQSIIYSWNLADQNSWNTVTLEDACTLYDVAWSDQELQFMAVGSNGAIFSSADGASWQTEVISSAEVSTSTEIIGEPTAETESGIGISSLTFYGVVYGNGTWLAVGLDGSMADDEAGVIYVKNGTAWEEVDTGISSKALYGIAYGGNTGFMAVGREGTVLSSINGAAWQTVTLVDKVGINLQSSDNFYAVIRDNARGRYVGPEGSEVLHYQFIVAGENGLILAKSDGLDYWEDYSIVTESSIKGVAVR